MKTNFKFSDANTKQKIATNYTISTTELLRANVIRKKPAFVPTLIDAQNHLVNK